MGLQDSVQGLNRGFNPDLCTHPGRTVETWKTPFDGRMAFVVPEGRYDRSLARSAWDSATQKSRPVGYGLIRAGVRTDSMIGVTKFRVR
jgi:hypothetical protein